MSLWDDIADAAAAAVDWTAGAVVDVLEWTDDATDGLWLVGDAADLALGALATTLDVADTWSDVAGQLGLSWADLDVLDEWVEDHSAWDGAVEDLAAAFGDWRTDSIAAVVGVDLSTSDGLSGAEVVDGGTALAAVAVGAVDVDAEATYEAEGWTGLASLAGYDSPSDLWSTLTPTSTTEESATVSWLPDLGRGGR